MLLFDLVKIKLGKQTKLISDANDFEYVGKLKISSVYPPMEPVEKQILNKTTIPLDAIKYEEMVECGYKDFFEIEEAFKKSYYQNKKNFDGNICIYEFKIIGEN